MNLFKVEHTIVDGWEGASSSFFTYKLSTKDTIENDEPLSREDVVENDVVYDTYCTYKNMGQITVEEVETLMKFKIV